MGAEIEAHLLLQGEPVAGKTYWVKERPFPNRQVGAKPGEMIDPGWTPMRRSQSGKWFMIGDVRELPEDRVEFVGNECRVTDSEARRLLRSVMNDIEEMSDSAADEPMYGPFSEYDVGSHGASISWGNLDYERDRYTDLLDRERGRE